MSEFKEVCDKFFRLCNAFNCNCNGCPLHGKCIVDGKFDPDVVHEIIDTWAKEHTAKTYKSELMKAFPKCDFTAVKSELCPKEVFGFGPYANDGLTCDGNCDLCWNKEIKNE